MLHVSSSVAHFLRVLQYFVWFRSFGEQRFCMVVDDVRCVYGSVVHDASKILLHLAGFPDAIAILLLLATTHATMHGWFWRALRSLGALVGWCSSQLFSLGDSVLCCSGSARFLGILRVRPC